MLEKLSFFIFATKKLPKTYGKWVLFLISKYLQDIHILYKYYWIPHTQKHEYGHQNRDSRYAMPNLWPNMWFRWRPFWMCHKTRLRGGKNWTPIFLAYLSPKEAIKTIKSIWATEMARMTYRTRLRWHCIPNTLLKHSLCCLRPGMPPHGHESLRDHFILLI